MFIRRDGRSSTRFIVARVGLFFLAAGLWLAGVSVGDDRITAVAIGVAFVALLFGWVARRGREEEEA